MENESSKRRGCLRYVLGAVLALLAAVGGCVAWLIAADTPLQTRVGARDKIQKSDVPYTRAVRSALGESFARDHEPFGERRIVCDWDGVPSDCGEFGFANRERLTLREIAHLESVLLDPCRHLAPSLSADSHLRSVCAAGVYTATAVRRTPSGRFQMRMKPTTNSSDNNLQERKKP